MGIEFRASKKKNWSESFKEAQNSSLSFNKKGNYLSLNKISIEFSQALIFELYKTWTEYSFFFGTCTSRHLHLIPFWVLFCNALCLPILSSFFLSCCYRTYRWNRYLNFVLNLFTKITILKRELSREKSQGFFLQLFDLSTVCCEKVSSFKS